MSGTDSILNAIDNDNWLKAHAWSCRTSIGRRPRLFGRQDLPRIAARWRDLAGHCGPPRQRRPPRPTELRRRPRPRLREFADAITGPRRRCSQDLAALSAWQETFVNELKRLMSMATPPPLKVEAIPEMIRDHVASTIDQPPGQYLYALYIEPKDDLWNRDALRAFVKDVEARVAAVPGAPPVTGIAPDVYHSTRSIQLAFYQATAYALCLIFILVLIDLRNLAHTLVAVSVLALGLPMLVAIMGWMGASLELCQLLRPADPYRRGPRIWRVSGPSLSRGLARSPPRLAAMGPGRSRAASVCVCYMQQFRLFLVGEPASGPQKPRPGHGTWHLLYLSGGVRGRAVASHLAARITPIEGASHGTCRANPGQWPGGCRSSSRVSH